jgi:hypothetical protein
MYERKRPKTIVSLIVNSTGVGGSLKRETSVLITTLKTPSSENMKINKNKLFKSNIIIFF